MLFIFHEQCLHRATIGRGLWFSTETRNVVSVFEKTKCPILERCKHCCCCFKCATQLLSARCPMCRATITDLQSIKTANHSLKLKEQEQEREYTPKQRICWVGVWNEMETYTEMKNRHEQQRRKRKERMLYWTSRFPLETNERINAKDQYEIELERKEEKVWSDWKKKWRSIHH